MPGLERIDLLGSQLHAGENEDGANQNAGDRAERIECLGKVETPLRTFRVTELRDKGIGRRFQERQATGNHEKGKKKKSVLADQRRRPEQKRSQSEQK